MPSKRPLFFNLIAAAMLALASLSAVAGIISGETERFVLLKGIGDPNGNVSAAPGSLYVRMDGTNFTTLYVKEAGTNTYGWEYRNIFTNPGTNVTDLAGITFRTGANAAVGQIFIRNGEVFVGTAGVADFSKWDTSGRFVPTLGMIWPAGQSLANLSLYTNIFIEGGGLQFRNQGNITATVQRENGLGTVTTDGIIGDLVFRTDTNDVRISIRNGGATSWRLTKTSLYFPDGSFLTNATGGSGAGVTSVSLNGTNGQSSAGISGSALTLNLRTNPPVPFIVYCSDLTTPLTVGTSRGYFRMPFGGTISVVRASLLTASSSGLPTVNIKKNGTTIFSTKLTINASQTTSTTATTPAVLSVTSLADDDLITFDIDVAGTGAAGLAVTLLVNP